MRRFIAASLLFIVSAYLFAAPSAQVPRMAPDLSFVDASGKAISLSSFKGKVVAVEIFFVKSMHCVRVAQTLNKLNHDLGARGFQALAVAFSAPQADADAATIGTFVESFGLAFPAGYTDKDNVDRFMGRTQNEVLSIPQVVIIDRTGMIRAQSGDRPGDPRLEDEAYLRMLLDGLLKENTQNTPKSAAPNKKS
jgi:peroxiredoxin